MIIISGIIIPSMAEGEDGGVELLEVDKDGKRVIKPSPRLNRQIHTNLGGFDMNQEFNESALITSSQRNETDNVPITTTEEVKPKDEPKRNNCRIYMLFFVVLFLNLLINFDHGVMPAAAIRMQEDLDLNNMQFGWLGSIVFIGLTLGKPIVLANTS